MSASADDGHRHTQGEFAMGSGMGSGMASGDDAVASEEVDSTKLRRRLAGATASAGAMAGNGGGKVWSGSQASSGGHGGSSAQSSAGSTGGGSAWSKSNAFSNGGMFGGNWAGSQAGSSAGSTGGGSAWSNAMANGGMFGGNWAGSQAGSTGGGSSAGSQAGSTGGGSAWSNAMANNGGMFGFGGSFAGSQAGSSGGSSGATSTAGSTGGMSHTFAGSHAGGAHSGGSATATGGQASSVALTNMFGSHASSGSTGTGATTGAHAGTGPNGSTAGATAAVNPGMVMPGMVMPGMVMPGMPAWMFGGQSGAWAQTGQTGAQSGAHATGPGSMTSATAQTGPNGSSATSGAMNGRRRVLNENGETYSIFGETGPDGFHFEAPEGYEEFTNGDVSGATFYENRRRAPAPANGFVMHGETADGGNFVSSGISTGIFAGGMPGMPSAASGQTTAGVAPQPTKPATDKSKPVEGKEDSESDKKAVCDPLSCSSCPLGYVAIQITGTECCFCRQVPQGQQPVFQPFTWPHAPFPTNGVFFHMPGGRRLE